ncbi:serine hydrolase domain-containing protein [Stenotrophomonas sp. PS02289]|uniref:serine hydrolase domain-containing protein n=1 Tax=Stenotrophomonas sp. PS02289 TaxID=2991422 RepID=UPI00249AC170|nr:serine hydrolase domain-containing protein [Stenotrophomonas sp. PS02289]
MKHRTVCLRGGMPLRVATIVFALLALPAAAADLHDVAVDAALDAGLRPGILEPGASQPRWSLQQRMSEHHVPGVAIAVLRDGKLVHAAGYGVRAAGSADPVNADTLFSVGSVSKVVTAATTLRLVADHRLDLDQNIQQYLTDWRVPGTAATPHPYITLRMLLSHTSGLGVHGFADYLPGEALPTLLQTLDGVPPAKNQPIRLVHAPGERGDYSGGGVMVEQHVLESVSGQRLDALARAQVFTPVGMSRSRFDGPPEDIDNIAKAHDGKGAVTALPRGWQSFPEAGASGLWTSAADLGRFVAALTTSYQGKNTFLPRPLATDMMTAVSPSWHGLGPRLDGDGMQRIFHHGGSNDSYRALIEGYLETGDGFVILTNGENGAALAAEIRNALSDVIGRGVNPVVRSIALDPQSAVVASIAGRYQRSDAVPMALQGALADVFDIPAVEVTVGENGVRMGVAGTRRSGQLLPVSPNRFVSPDIDGLQVEFQRDAWGEVSGVVLMLGDARAYYVQ